MGCGCGGAKPNTGQPVRKSARAVPARVTRRRPTPRFYVYDLTGRHVATYNTKYEARAHADRNGWPNPIPA